MGRVGLFVVALAAALSLTSLGAGTAYAGPGLDVSDSCISAIVNGAQKNALGYAGAFIPAVKCAGAAGGLNAQLICWRSRQPWGYYDRGLVWVITGGRYTRC